MGYSRNSTQAGPVGGCAAFARKWVAQSFTGEAFSFRAMCISRGSCRFPSFPRRAAFALSGEAPAPTAAGSSGRQRCGADSGRPLWIPQQPLPTDWMLLGSTGRRTTQATRASSCGGRDCNEKLPLRSAVMRVPHCQQRVCTKAALCPWAVTNCAASEGCWLPIDLGAIGPSDFVCHAFSLVENHSRLVEWAVVLPFVGMASPGYSSGSTAGSSSGDSGRVVRLSWGSCALLCSAGLPGGSGCPTRGECFFDLAQQGH